MFARGNPHRPAAGRLALLGAGLVAVVSLALSSPAGAVSNPDYTVPPPSTTIITETVPSEPVPARQVTTAVQVERARTSLAITGSDLNLAAALGAGSIVVGAAILVARRRRIEVA